MKPVYTALFGLVALAAPFAAPLAANAADTAPAISVSAADLMSAKASDSWLTYGHDYSNQRFSANEQITSANVVNLAPAFVFQTGVSQPFEATPVVANGKMFFTTAYDHVFAADAMTGKKIWEYQPKLSTTVFCCGPVNRGVAVSGNTVFLGQLDGKLVALDASTGRISWQIQAGDNKGGYSLTMAPLVYKDSVIVGGAGGEYGIRGSVSAYSVADGHQLWQYWTVGPESWANSFSAKTPDGADLHRDLATEKADFSKYADAWKSGGGTVWMTPAIDSSMDAIFVATGNPSPDLFGDKRPGDNRNTDSIVAINATTGKEMWAYQEVPHDVWDLDTVSPVVLFDTIDKTGKTVAAVGQAGKTGWFYIIDRKTGQLIRRSKNFVPQENMFAQPTEKGVRMLPGANGGVDWSPVSYDPKLHYAIVSALHQPMNYLKKPQERPAGALWLGSAFVAIPTETQYGLLSAINVDTGDIAWQKKVDYPLLGGSVTTAGGVTFVGEGNGFFDAFDTKSGKQLWQFQTGAGVNAAPMVYAVNGVEYVAIAAGGSYQIGTQYGDALYVFRLPKAPSKELGKR